MARDCDYCPPHCPKGLEAMEDKGLWRFCGRHNQSLDYYDGWLRLEECFLACMDSINWRYWG